MSFFEARAYDEFGGWWEGAGVSGVVPVVVG